MFTAPANLKQQALNLFHKLNQVKEEREEERYTLF